MNVPQEHLRKAMNVPLESLTTVEVCDLKMSQKVASQVLKGNFWNYYDTFLCINAHCFTLHCLWTHYPIHRKVIIRAQLYAKRGGLA